VASEVVWSRVSIPPIVVRFVIQSILIFKKMKGIASDARNRVSGKEPLLSGIPDP
jgi:hypothetical protein